MHLDPNQLKRIRLEDIYVFKILCETSNYTTTARITQKTQGTISLQINRLEEILNTKLIERNSKSFNITVAGNEFLEFSNLVLDEFSKMVKKFNSIKNVNQKGLIRIATSTIPNENILPNRIVKFKEQYPSINFEIHMQNSLKALEFLEHEQIEFAIIGLKLDNTKKEELESYKIGTDSLIFLCSKNHPLAKESFITLEDIFKYPFILREKGSGTRKTFEKSRYFSDQISIAFEFDSNTAILNSIKNSNYISVVSSYSIKSLGWNPKDFDDKGDKNRNNNSNNFDNKDNYNNAESDARYINNYFYSNYHILKPFNYKTIQRSFYIVRKKKKIYREIDEIFWKFMIKFKE